MPALRFNSAPFEGCTSSASRDRSNDNCATVSQRARASGKIGLLSHVEANLMQAAIFLGTHGWPLVAKPTQHNHQTGRWR
jgi:hypothetical protein